MNRTRTTNVTTHNNNDKDTTQAYQKQIWLDSVAETVHVDIMTLSFVMIDVVTVNCHCQFVMIDVATVMYMWKMAGKHGQLPGT